MKTVPEILAVKYHQTIGTGTIQTPGHSTLAEAAVVVPPQAFADGPHGEMLGEHIDAMEGHDKILDAHAKEGHLGTHFAHVHHEMTEKHSEIGLDKYHDGHSYHHDEENHPHRLHGDDERHNPHKHGHHGKSHKTPHKG